MFWESELLFVVVLAACLAACLACGLLAARKGYNIFFWTAAGGLIVSFVVLAFLPFVNKDSQGNNKQIEKTGNWVGAALAAVSIVGFASLILHLIDRTSLPIRPPVRDQQMVLPEPIIQDEPSGSPQALGVPTLVSPKPGEDLDNGRRNGQDLIIWDFRWPPVDGADKYELFVISSKAKHPVINMRTAATSYHSAKVGDYIIDANRLGWRWQVRAIRKGQSGEWTPYSTFDVEPLNSDAPQE